MDGCTERARATPPARRESVCSLLTPLFPGKGSQLWAVLGWLVPCAHGGGGGMGDAGRRRVEGDRVIAACNCPCRGIHIIPFSYYSG